ncbi:DUF5788 family protein [Halobium salinum]|uniref:DUF5788 family protein n=1 Tax=Halobium salinum TaxID=1364940 RepID=A0ABD5P945_9EURY|nr:DUF5788 family protein [Halobium salinum]
MNDADRRQLLDEVDRPGATVGKAVPERVTVQGESLALREFVFEAKRHEVVPDDLEEEVEETKRELRRERLRRYQRTEREELSVEEGRRLVDSIHGIDRALNALSTLEPVDLEDEMRDAAVESHREWFSFLRQIL